MTHRPIHCVLAHGWEGDDVAARDQSPASGADDGLEEVLALLGE